MIVAVELAFRVEAAGFCFFFGDFFVVEGDLVLLTMAEDPVVEVNGYSAIDCFYNPTPLQCRRAIASSGRGMAEVQPGQSHLPRFFSRSSDPGRQ